MADRLSPLDVHFLYLEEPETPMHVGGVEVFQAPELGFDYDRLVRLVRERIAYVPRYRQRIRWVPGRLANPVWVDDERFDVTYHIRRSALPRPGTDRQLYELVARIMSRPLDRSRPLWEMYLIEGLEGDRFAILTKSHEAMVDGLSAVDIGQVILDATPEPRQVAPDAWRPAAEPTRLELVAGALSDTIRRPATALDTVREGVGDVKETLVGVGRQAVGVVTATLNAARPTQSSPLLVELGEHRRFATATTELEDYKRVRQAHGGTINDVALAVVTGGLRSWLQTRGLALDSRREVKALVPVSVHGEGDGYGEQRVAAFTCDLPVGEPDPVVRLQRIAYEMGQHKESGRMLGARAIVGLVGFAPPTLHALGTRVGAEFGRRVYSLVVTNVPGPQFPLYVAGARMLASYPVLPLGKGQAVTIGLTSYDGSVYFGLNADRDGMPDVEVLAHCLEDALDELVETTTTHGRHGTVG
ncbi:MAG: wax ester/triacylglycerol synthase family O-acyltransferase [Candidatus Nanopelagicales bacterium]